MLKTLPTTLLLAALPWITPSLAQNESSDNSTCAIQRSIDALEDGHVNSTGNAEISWSDLHIQTPDGTIAMLPWYLSVYVNDTRNNTINGRPSTGWDVEVQPYLSVANNVHKNTSVCVYQFSSVNATSTGDQADQSIGCAGVLSDDCASHVRESLLNASRDARADTCGQPWSTDADRQRQRDACGDHFQGNFVTLGPLDLTQDNCSVPDLQGADIPDKYHSFAVGGTLSPYQEIIYTETANSSAAYDLRVNQAMPFAVVANFLTQESNNGVGLAVDHVQLVCVTPNNTLEGSRVPESRTPWGSSSSPAGSSAGTKWNAKGTWALVIAGLVGSLFVL